MTKAKILIVEDEIIIAKNTESNLGKIGYETSAIVNNGADAIDFVDIHRPDLVLMDIKIKGSLDGIETAKIIQSEFEVPVIFLSSSCDDETIDRAKLIMPYGFLLKSAQLIQLKISIEIALQVAEQNRNQKNLSKRLSESEEKYRAAFQSSPEAMMLTHIDGLFVDVNEGFTRLTGYSPGEVLGRFSLEIGLWALPKDRKKIIARLQENGNAENVETEITGKQGAKKTVLISAKKLQLEGEMYFLSVIRDISKRKECETKLKSAKDSLEQSAGKQTKELLASNNALLMASIDADNAIRSKSDFIANISHELRSPVHSILSYSNIALENPHKVNSEKVTHYFTQINKISNKLNLLINDLLDLEKMESGRMNYQMKSAYPKRLVEEIKKEFSLIAKEKGLKIVLRPGSYGESIYCDPFKIEQVLRNLISNAIKFSSKSSKIMVETTKVQNVNGTRWSDITGMDGVCFRVSDEGFGVPEAELKTIFDKYIQSNNVRSEGTGLGLSISKEIVLAHKGKIWAENNASGGLSVFFILPIDQNSKPEL